MRVITKYQDFNSLILNLKAIHRVLTPFLFQDLVPTVQEKKWRNHPMVLKPEKSPYSIKDPMTYLIDHYSDTEFELTDNPAELIERRLNILTLASCSDYKEMEEKFGVTFPLLILQDVEAYGMEVINAVCVLSSPRGSKCPEIEEYKIEKAPWMIYTPMLDESDYSNLLSLLRCYSDITPALLRYLTPLEAPANASLASDDFTRCKFFEGSERATINSGRRELFQLCKVLDFKEFENKYSIWLQPYYSRKIGNGGYIYKIINRNFE